MSDLLQSFPVGFVAGPNAGPGTVDGQGQDTILDASGLEAARREIASWPGYAPTPLVSLPGFAAAAGVEALWYKDEGARFGLGSFKALGGAYAVCRLLRRQAAARAGVDEVSTADLTSGRYREIVSGITVCTATDGNHGRSVAWGAQTFGCRCVIYIHATVSEGRKQAMEHFGAEVRRIEGNYDDSVHQAARDAAANGWFVVSDTSYPGYTEIPRDVMHGYMLMADETIEQLSHGPGPTHVFVQGGVGGLAAAVCARFRLEHGETCPRFVVVEPTNAACLFESAKAGRPVVVAGDLDTVMAGLAAGEVSLLAWSVLQGVVDGFMTVPDEAAEDLMRLLARGVGGDPPVVAGESAVAGLAGAIGALRTPEVAEALQLDGQSRVLVFGTEGATDTEVYRRIVGRSPEAVAAG
ncbi:MAG: diaminopropionate ammonia-lyase [Rhodospirillales bacterium]|nr:diaminopropionate ammonia-lyase [Rhodospirillales bacterium]